MLLSLFFQALSAQGMVSVKRLIARRGIFSFKGKGGGFLIDFSMRNVENAEQGVASRFLGCSGIRQIRPGECLTPLVLTPW